MSTLLRIATPADAPALRAIYAPYVTETAITFEYDVPDAAEFAARIRNTLMRYPYLIAERDGVPVGYAYASAFHARAAYAWGAETSIYVRRDCRRGGVGRALSAALEQILRMQGLTNLNACIATPPQADDATLTRDSVRFHAALGYRPVGEFTQCGYKFGRWYNIVWMEKHIAPHHDVQPPVKRFDEIRADAQALLARINAESADAR